MKGKNSDREVEEGMRNKKLFKSVVLFTTVMLLVSGCGKQAEPVSAEPTETVSEVEPEESTEEILESSPTVEETEKPVESTEVEEISESEVETTEEEVEQDLGYEIISIDNTVMYATTNCNIRAGAGTEYDVVGSLSYAQEITVNGKVETDGSTWYVIKTDNDEIKMVSGSLLSTTKPAQQQSTGNGGGSSSSGNGGGSTSQEETPQHNVGDIMGYDQNGHPMIYGGEVDTSDFH